METHRKSLLNSRHVAALFGYTSETSIIKLVNNNIGIGEKLGRDWVFDQVDVIKLEVLLGKKADWDSL